MTTFITKPDDHSEDFNILLDEVMKYIRPRGVIHIGAHKGQEVPIYAKYGFGQIALIEANPAWCDYLKQSFSQNPAVKILNYAISDQQGQYEFHIHTSRSGSTEAASLLPMKEFNKIVKTLHTPEKIMVPATTMDLLFGSAELNIAEYNVLTLDIQGAELMALRGTIDNLQLFAAIIVEVNLIELYQNAPLEKDIINFLEQSGFSKVYTIYHELYDETKRFNAWGEAVFINQKCKTGKN